MLNLVVDILMFHQDRVPLLFQSYVLCEFPSKPRDEALGQGLVQKVGKSGLLVKTLYSRLAAEVMTREMYCTAPSAAASHFTQRRKFCLRRGRNFEILSLCKRILPFVFAQRRYETVQKLEMGPELRL